MAMTESEPPWRDKETLERMHFEQGLDQGEMAERLGCTRRTVAEWFSRHGIEGRVGAPQQPKVYLRIKSGYRRAENRTEPDRGKFVDIHRLVAVAEWGFGAVRDKHVHHKNGFPIDNRPENLELLTPSEHGELHHETDWDNTGEGNPNSTLSEEDVNEIRERKESSTAPELADEYGVSTSAIYNVWSGWTWNDE